MTETSQPAGKGETGPLLSVEDVTVTFGGIQALVDVSFGIKKGEICGLIGPNGAGKTTLFNVLSRLVEPTSGSITFDGTTVLGVPPREIAPLGLGRTFQNLGLFKNMTVLENVMVGAHHRTESGFFDAMLQLPKKRREDREVRQRAEDVLLYLSLADVAYMPAQGLPFGTLKRVEIARAIATEPRLLMLDEPASGLSSSEVETLANLIYGIRDEFGTTILLVEHHMGFVMSIADKVVCLDFGKKIADGPPKEVQNDPKVIEAYLGVAA